MPERFKERTGEKKKKSDSGVRNLPRITLRLLFRNDEKENAAEARVDYLAMNSLYLGM